MAKSDQSDRRAHSREPRNRVPIAKQSSDEPPTSYDYYKRGPSDPQNAGNMK